MREESPVNDLLTLVGIVLVYVVLMRFVLPRFGIAT